MPKAYSAYFFFSHLTVREDEMAVANGNTIGPVEIWSSIC